MGLAEDICNPAIFAGYTYPDQSGWLIAKGFHHDLVAHPKGRAYSYFVDRVLLRAL
jgi:hypothetical protein